MFAKINNFGFKKIIILDLKNNKLINIIKFYMISLWEL